MRSHNALTQCECFERVLPRCDSGRVVWDETLERTSIGVGALVRVYVLT